jgi:hypothetical protein
MMLMIAIMLTLRTKVRCNALRDVSDKYVICHS